MNHRFLVAWVAAGTVAAGAQSVGPVSTQPPNEDLYVYRTLPDIEVRTKSKPAMRLSAIGKDQPLLVTMVFARCSGVCYPFLRSLKSAADALPAGRSEYRILVLSFDPRDTPADVESAAASIGVKGRPDWLFGAASPDDVRRLSEATGFWFKWDGERRQFDHPAVLLAVRQGRLVRLYSKATISASALGGIVWELLGGFVRSYPSAGDDTVFRCFQYDAASRRFTLDWGALLMILPAAAAALATIATFGFRRQL